MILKTTERVRRSADFLKSTHFTFGWSAVSAEIKPGRRHECPMFCWATDAFKSHSKERSRWWCGGRKNTSLHSKI